MFAMHSISINIFWVYNYQARSIVFEGEKGGGQNYPESLQANKQNQQ